MKVRYVSVEVLRTPVADPYVAAGHAVDANWQVVSIVETDTGITGFGYVVQPRAELVAALRERHLRAAAPRERRTTGWSWAELRKIHDAQAQVIFQRQLRALPLFFYEFFFSYLYY